MAVDRKCTKCGIWNKDLDHCSACGQVLNPVLIEVERSQKRQPIWTQKETAFDRFLFRWKNSRFLVLRVLYKICYTVAVIFLSIAAFFAYLAASPNG